MIICALHHANLPLRRPGHEKMEQLKLIVKAVLEAWNSEYLQMRDVKQTGRTVLLTFFLFTSFIYVHCLRSRDF